jgi:hypothetical protein
MKSEQAVLPNPCLEEEGTIFQTPIFVKQLTIRSPCIWHTVNGHCVKLILQSSSPCSLFHPFLTRIFSFKFSANSLIGSPPRILYTSVCPGLWLCTCAVSYSSAGLTVCRFINKWVLECEWLWFHCLKAKTVTFYTFHFYLTLYLEHH